MDTTSDSLLESAVMLMVVRLLHYSEVMEQCDRDAMAKAERFVKRSIMLAKKHKHDVAKLLDTAYKQADAAGISNKRRKYLGFILYDMRVREGIIKSGDIDNISPST